MFHVVLDINGVLIQRDWSRSSKPINERDNVIPMEAKRGYMHVFIRPGAIELIHAIINSGGTLVFWSSMTREYMMPIVYLLVDKAGIKESWYPRILTQAECQAVPHPDITIKFKPLFLKDEKRIYERFPNTDGVIFIDDNPCKMRLNEDSELIIVKEWEDPNDIEDKELFNVISDELKLKINNLYK
jgi:hypothetical protein